MALSQRRTTLGPLNAVVVDDAARMGPPSLVVILCHGFGAPADDLVGLAGEIVRGLPWLAGGVRFVFPEGPLALDNVPFGGRAWWPIDMLALQRALERGEARKMADEVPPALTSARQKLRGLIDAVHTETGLPLSKIVVGGFSQGAMLSTDVALRLEEAPAALLVLSGALIDQSEWRRRAPARKGLPVLQSHGTNDPILPYDGAVALKSVLVDAGLDVTFVQFRGGHGIDGAVITAITTLLTKLVPAPLP